MRTLESKIREEVARRKVRWDIIEKDYILSYVLLGIAKQADLAKTLIFKGGTALKKCYFGDYRFSEDLDFSSIDAPKGALLENALNDAMRIATESLNQNSLFEIQLKRKIHRNPHPRGQEDFDVRVNFPGRRIELSCSIKVEITHDELVLLPPVESSIVHGYDEIFDATILCYHIEEIIVEKLRAVLQTHDKLVREGRARTRPRDYYDLWHLLKKYGRSVDRKRLQGMLEKKCQHRGVFYHSIDDFFMPLLVDRTNKSWKNSLHLQINELPECQYVLDETKTLIQELLWAEL